MSEKSLNGSALQRAARFGHEKVIAQLLTAQPQLIGEMDNKRRTPLHIAAENGHENAVTELLSKGANPTRTDFSGYTALHRAVKSGHIKVVAQLLAHNPKLAGFRAHTNLTVVHIHLWPW